jgi:hypothetical protein
MSTIKVDTIQKTSGVEVYPTNIWCNHNGTGTKTINASGNVSSLTDGGTGLTTYNFGITLSSANYSVAFGCTGNLNSTVVIDAAGAGSAPDVKSTTQLGINEIISGALGDIYDLSLHLVV